eukprot:scaffold5873_cov172-Amphora_coffeaeformis.AAC.16
MLSTGFLVLLSSCLSGIVAYANTLETLRPDEFRERILAGDFDVIVDVRRRDGEWDLGHIPEATLVENLALFSPGSGCEYCAIIVYCRSGARAGRAISILQENGFKGRLYNGLGIGQWTGSPYNYELVNTSSVTPPCTFNQTVSDQCYNDWVARTSDTTEARTVDEEAGTLGTGNGVLDDGDTNDPSLSSSSSRNMMIFPWFILAGGFCGMISS